jgi:hypothetical protein
MIQSCKRAKNKKQKAILQLMDNLKMKNIN